MLDDILNLMALLFITYVFIHLSYYIYSIHIKIGCNKLLTSVFPNLTRRKLYRNMEYDAYIN
jgi:hypothetical protein